MRADFIRSPERVCVGFLEASAERQSATLFGQRSDFAKTEEGSRCAVVGHTRTHRFAFRNMLCWNRVPNRELTDHSGGSSIARQIRQYEDRNRLTVFDACGTNRTDGRLPRGDDGVRAEPGCGLQGLGNGSADSNRVDLPSEERHTQNWSVALSARLHSRLDLEPPVERPAGSSRNL